MKTKLLSGLTILFFVIFTSCSVFSDIDTASEEECNDPDYSDCNTTEPIVGKLKIKVKINDENPTVRLEIFDGDVEDGFPILKTTVDSENFETEVSVNRSYSAKAYYKSGQDSVVAIDGTKVKKSKVVYCDSTCWTVTNGNLDLRIK